MRSNRTALRCGLTAAGIAVLVATTTDSAAAGEFSVANCQADPLNFSTRAFDDFATRNPALLDKRLLTRFYRSTTLATDAARTGRVPPDAAVFPWQAALATEGPQASNGVRGSTTLASDAAAAQFVEAKATMLTSGAAKGCAIMRRIKRENLGAGWREQFTEGLQTCEGN